jgi:hypothetical protein
VLHRSIRNGIRRFVESGLGGRAKTDKAKEYEEIHDTPLQQFLLLKKIFIYSVPGKPPRTAAGAAMRGPHARKAISSSENAKESSKTQTFDAAAICSSILLILS